MGRGLEISEPQRVVKDPDNTTNWTNRRTFSLGESRVCVLEVQKGPYRTPATGFKLEWFTARSDTDLVVAAAGLYLQLKNKFDTPSDFVSRMFERKAKVDALKLAGKLNNQGLLGMDLDELKRNKAEIEPVRVSIRRRLRSRRNNFYFYPDDPDKGPEVLGKELLDHLPLSQLSQVKFEWPYGSIVFVGGVERVWKRISFESRYRYLGEVLEFVRSTSVVPIDIHERRQINERLRKLIHLLPRPDQA